ncbi:hypothetical protein ACI7RC_22330 [Brevibacillus sp. B_LB10_24]|uniref:hypothetical protein n=1 Tax=Brevibacillus sp. B_LB10_24 TaxID=3380645 RepID=UPI0038BC20BC
MIGWLILACEIGFWVFVCAGLFTRYVLHLKKLSGILLLCTPLLDLILIVMTVADMKNGAAADFFHGLAAIYVGVTVAFGHQMIQWMDKYFAYWFAKGAKPERTAKYGPEHAKRERMGWYRHLLAWAIGVALLFGIIAIVGNPEQTDKLQKMAGGWSIVLLIDFVISFSYTIMPRKRPG